MIRATHGIIQSQSGGFVPFAYADFRLWLDANDLNTLFDATSGGSLVSSDGATVRRCEDKSGNNNHATNITGCTLKLGIYNGKNILRFNGSNQGLNGTAQLFSGDEARTVYIVVQSLATGTGSCFFDASNFASTARSMKIGGEIATRCFNVTWVSTTTLGAAVGIISLTYSGGLIHSNMNMWKGSTGITRTGGNNGTLNSTNPYSIGFSNNGLTFTAMDACEIFCYGGVHDATTRAAFWSYLSAKWGAAI